MMKSLIVRTIIMGMGISSTLIPLSNALAGSSGNPIYADSNGNCPNGMSMDLKSGQCKFTIRILTNSLDPNDPSTPGLIEVEQKRRQESKPEVRKKALVRIAQVRANVVIQQREQEKYNLVQIENEANEACSQISNTKVVVLSNGYACLKK